MKKLLLILLLSPLFTFGQTYYRLYADTTILGSIGSGYNELVLKNRTKDTVGGFLVNKNGGATEFRKIIVKKLNDTSYILASGNNVLGDTIKISNNNSGGGGGISQGQLDDSILSVRNIRNVDSIYKKNTNRDFTFFTINGNEYSFSDSIGITDSTLFATKNYVNSLNASKLNVLDTISQNLGIRNDYINRLILKANQTSLNDSIKSIRLIRKVDTSYLQLNAGLDSLVFTNIINGIKYRTSTLRTASGGSVPISGLTSATANNTIDNGEYTQEWQWNSQTKQPMLKLSSTSTDAVNGGNGLEINLTGGLGDKGLTTYAAKFINSRMSTNGANSGAYFEGNNGYGVAIQTGSSPAGGNLTGADIAIGNNGKLLWNNGEGNGSHITVKPYLWVFQFYAMNYFNFKSSSLLGSYFNTVDYRPEIVLGLQSATRSSISFGADNSNANGTYYRAAAPGTACIIERNLGKLLFSTNVGLSGTYANFTPTYQICIDGTNNNVAIGNGNIAGNVSAKLEVVSTTQGFLPPRMTTAQKNAIATPAEGLIVYDLTLHKLCVYTGSAWETITSL